MLSNKRLNPLQVQIGDGTDGAPSTPTSLGGAKMRHHAHSAFFTESLDLPRPATATSPSRTRRRLRTYRFWHALEGLVRRPGTKRRLFSAFCLALFFGAFFMDLEFPGTTFLMSNSSLKAKQSNHAAALAGMGHLWGLGSRAMSELIIAHVSEQCSPETLRLFLRSAKHSKALGHADLVLLMPKDALLEGVVSEEEGVFQRVKAGLAESWLRETAAQRIEAQRARSLMEQGNASDKIPELKESEGREAVEGDAKAVDTADNERERNGGAFAGEEKTPDLDPESKSGAKLNELANTDTGSATTVDEGTIQRAAQMGSSLKDGASIRVVQAIQSPVVVAPLVIPNLDEDTRSYVWGDDNRTAMPERLDDFLSFDGPAWGATVSFSMDELDLLGGLEGFMEPVPETLRRWVCYQTLLGRLRHRYKYVLLIEADDTVILGDPLGAVRVQNGLYLTASDLPWKTVDPSDAEGKSIMNSTYGNKWWQALDPNEHNTPLVDEGAVLGSMKAVRALADAVVNEAVRVAQQRRDRLPLSDQALLNNLVYKSALMQDKKFEPMQLLSNRDSVVHSMAGSAFLDQAFTNAIGDDYAILHRFDSKVPVLDEQNITSLLRARLCKDDKEVWHHQDCS